MASLADILNWWDENVVPIVAQRMATFSSFRHKDDLVPMSEVEGLEDAINSKPSAIDFNAAIEAEASTRADADTALAADIATKVSKWENWQGNLNVEGDVIADGLYNPDSFWEISGAGDATFRNATINTLSNVVLKVNADGKLVAAVAGTDYQTPIGYAPVNKAGDTMLGHLTLVGDAVNALHPITKSQFDNLQTGLSWKYSARASTVAALPSYTVSGDFLTLTATANGALALDGVTLVAGDRILVKNEAGAAKVNNGGYTVTNAGSGSTKWCIKRTAGADTNDGLNAATFYVREGTIEANRIYAVNTNPVTLGTTQIAFALVAGAGTYANGTGLDLTGNVFSIANAGVSNAMLAGGIADAKISSAANWNSAYNSRISNFTTTGNSGAATFAGNVLNVPNYTLSGLGGYPLTGGDLAAGSFVGLPNIATPATPSAGLKLYSDASGRLTWLSSLGYARTLRSAALTGNRLYTLQDRDGVLADDTDLATKLNVIGGDLTGTAGAGYHGFIAQSAAPGTPASGFRLYANATNSLAWKGANGFVRVFDGTANTADRTYTLPDASGTLPLLSLAQTFTALQTYSQPINALSTSGFVFYNTTDITTNYERLTLGYISGAYRFLSEKGGSGTARNFSFEGGNVSIGGASPSQALSVTGSGVFSAVLFSPGLQNNSNNQNSQVNTSSTGVSILRNIGDANPALTVRQQSASSTGDIQQWLNNSTTVAKISQSGIFSLTKIQLLALNTAPTSSTDTGTTGEIRIDANNIYVATGTNTWKRAALSTF